MSGSKGMQQTELAASNNLGTSPLAWGNGRLLPGPKLCGKAYHICDL